MSLTKHVESSSACCKITSKPCRYCLQENRQQLKPSTKNRSPSALVPPSPKRQSTKWTNNQPCGTQSLLVTSAAAAAAAPLTVVPVAAASEDAVQLVSVVGDGCVGSWWLVGCWCYCIGVAAPALVDHPTSVSLCVGAQRAASSISSSCCCVMPPLSPAQHRQFWAALMLVQVLGMQKSTYEQLIPKSLKFMCYNITLQHKDLVKDYRFNNKQVTAQLDQQALLAAGRTAIGSAPDISPTLIPALDIPLR